MGVLAAVEYLNADDIKRGSWLLLQVFEQDELTKEIAVLAKTGIIVYKDKRPVLFFTNDLLFTPHEKYMAWTDPQAVECVQGLAPLKRWIGDETAMRTTIMAPAIVVAYNMYMNSVDRFDQLRATVKGVRKECRLTSSMFSFIVDAAVQNSFSVSKLLGGGRKNAVVE